MYLSVVTANRQDDYGNNQLLRTRLHLKYFKEMSAKYLKNIDWEYLVVDYNPPNSALKYAKSDIFEDFEQVRILEMSQINQKVFDLHTALNFAVENAKGQYILITNFDVFLDERIFQFLKQKRIAKNTVYFADRYDLNWSKSQLEDREAEFTNNNFSGLRSEGILNYRHGTDESIVAHDTDASRLGSRRKWFERKRGNVVYSLANINRFIRWNLEKNTNEKNDSRIQEILCKFGLHTNASGDFILISKENFQTIEGFSQELDQYWHKDSEFLLRAVAEGIRHACFVDHIKVFHILTPNSGGNDSSYLEKYSYENLCGKWIQFFTPNVS